jgi:hypothetical protein
VGVAEIRNILQRRTDLSTFVVHLTRRQNATHSAQDALVGIALSGRLEARTPLGWAKTEDDKSDPAKQSQRVVCFSETPLEYIHSMVGPIDGRAIAMEPYGIALPKLKARKLGINPVWYIDMTTGTGDSHEWGLSKALDSLRDRTIEAAAADDRGFHAANPAKLFPFIEQMGTWPTSSKEFWWEREWRHAGHLALPATSVMWLCPENEIEVIQRRVGRELSPWIDPRWGVEVIVAHLAGFPSADVSPFRPRTQPKPGKPDLPF